MNNSNTSIDWSNPFNYPLQWIQESEVARREYQCQLYRVRLAMLGKPSKNLYQEELTSIINELNKEDQEAAKKLSCIKLPEGQSFIIRKAVGNRANQMASGVDSYEYQINDPYGIIDDDTEDLLSAQCSRDYIENNLESFSPIFSRDLTMAGVTAALVKYCPITNKNIIERVNPKNIWWDTMYNSVGAERFRGYSTMISWAKLKKMIEQDGDEINTDIEVPNKSILNKNGQPDKRIKVGNHKIRTLNDMDIYIKDLNSLATSPDLQGGLTAADYAEYQHDLRSCYNLNWYSSFATDAKERTNGGYNGDDVELTVIYDLNKKTEFKIINRRFVISANDKAFKRSIIYQIYDPINDQMNLRCDDFELKCPLIFKFEDSESRDIHQYPISPIMTFLDTHDQLCSWRAKRDHVSKLLAILRIETNGADASSLKKVLNVMGVVLDDIQGDINSIQFQYDYTAIDSQIQYLEDTIITGLHAYDQFDMLQTMGDRASAAESGMAVGALAQGLATHQNTIMSMYADIARQCIANRVVYNNFSEFAINNLGEYKTVTIQQMALDAIVKVKSKLAKQVQDRTLAANAITIASNFKDVLNEQGIAYFIEQAMFGNAPRKLASSFIKQAGPSEQEMALAQQEAQNQAQMLQQNQQMYEQNPGQYEIDNVMQNASPEEIDQIISRLQQPAGSDIESEAELEQAAQGLSPEMLDMEQQDGAMQTNLEGLTFDSGSAMANTNGYF